MNKKTLFLINDFKCVEELTNYLKIDSPELFMPINHEVDGNNLFMPSQALELSPQILLDEGMVLYQGVVESEDQLDVNWFRAVLEKNTKLGLLLNQDYDSLKKQHFSKAKFGGADYKQHYEDNTIPRLIHEGVLNVVADIPEEKNALETFIRYVHGRHDAVERHKGVFVNSLGKKLENLYFKGSQLSYIEYKPDVNQSNNAKSPIENYLLAKSAELAVAENLLEESVTITFNEAIDLVKCLALLPLTEGSRANEQLQKNEIITKNATTLNALKEHGLVSEDDNFIWPITKKIICQQDARSLVFSKYLETLLKSRMFEPKSLLDQADIDNISKKILESQEKIMAENIDLENTDIGKQEFSQEQILLNAFNYGCVFGFVLDNTPGTLEAILKTAEGLCGVSVDDDQRLKPDVVGHMSQHFGASASVCSDFWGYTVSETDYFNFVLLVGVHKSQPVTYITGNQANVEPAEKLSFSMRSYASEENTWENEKQKYILTKDFAENILVELMHNKALSMKQAQNIQKSHESALRGKRVVNDISSLYYSFVPEVDAINELAYSGRPTPKCTI